MLNASRTMMVLLALPALAALLAATTTPAEPLPPPPEAEETPGITAENDSEGVVTYRRSNDQPTDPMEFLLDEVERLSAEVTLLRRQLAESQLHHTQAARELAELQQFITDHHQFGTDFQQYQAVRDAAEREARQRQLEARRRDAESRRAERQQRDRDVRAQRAQEKSEADRLSRYYDAGFTNVGLDIWVGRMAYHYDTKETEGRQRIDYDPYLGLYYRPGVPETKIDFSRMTISGSVLNATEQTRNIGVAITFFDENSNQVGGEIVQINNARPNVPYPFTSTLDMALNRPFSTSSTYVLYADPAPVVSEEDDVP